jgi:copper(I)-binding protein
MKAILGLFGLILTFPAFADILIENPWIRASTGPNAALFMKLINTSSKPEKLINAQIEKCSYTELHTHLENEGIFRMVEVDSIDIPGSGENELKPGGQHVMLMKIHAPLQEGDHVPVILSFQDGPPLQLIAHVKTSATHKCGCGH